jgi:4-amino-4-deoxy-L-arabinose transferase-like glycosyltransferase
MRSMIFDPETLSPTIERRDMPSPTARLKPGKLAIILALVILSIASWIGITLLTYSLPMAPERLLRLYFICLLALSVIFLGSLLRRRSNEIFVFLAVWAVVLFPFYGSREPFLWLSAQAFRIHTSPLEQYLSQCKLVEFVENGRKQVLGRCDNLAIEDEVVLDVFYDSTGEFGQPPSQRSSEWKAAMGHFGPREVLINAEGRVTKISENFFEIIIPSSEWDGDDERF